MDRFAILKGLSPPKGKEACWHCPKCNHAVTFEGDLEKVYCSNCGVGLERNILRNSKIDIEIWGKEYTGYLSNMSTQIYGKRACVLFWINSEQGDVQTCNLKLKRTQIEALQWINFRNLRGKEIHFHHKKNTHYLLVQEIKFDRNEKTKRHQIKVVIDGALR
jgi:hypothetical protein